MSQSSQQEFPALSPHLWRVLGAAVLASSISGCGEMSRVITKLDPRVPPAQQPQGTPDDGASAQTSETIAETVAEPETTPPKPSKLYEWNLKGQKVSRIVIDTDSQRARFYAGEDEVGWSTIASGLPKYPTPTGEFSVIEKVANKRSNLYGKVVQGGRVIRSNAKAGRDPIPAGAIFEGAHMPYFMRLTYDGIGLHAGPIPNPGQPASHGCIRLPSTLAPVLFTHVPHGTPVTIVGSGPDYGNYMEKQRIAAAQRAAREAAQKRAEEEKAAQALVAAAASARSDDSTSEGSIKATSRVTAARAVVPHSAAPSEPAGAASPSHSPQDDAVAPGESRGAQPQSSVPSASTAAAEGVSVSTAPSEAVPANATPTTTSAATETVAPAAAQPSEQSPAATRVNPPVQDATSESASPSRSSAAGGVEGQAAPSGPETVTEASSKPSAPAAPSDPATEASSAPEQPRQPSPSSAQSQPPTAPGTGQQTSARSEPSEEEASVSQAQAQQPSPATGSDG